LSLDLTSSDFTNHADDNWCASVGGENGSSALYENVWTDRQHYICQYDSE